MLRTCGLSMGTQAEGGWCDGTSPGSPLQIISYSSVHTLRPRNALGCHASAGAQLSVLGSRSPVSVLGFHSVAWLGQGVFPSLPGSVLAAAKQACMQIMLSHPGVEVSHRRPSIRVVCAIMAMSGWLAVQPGSVRLLFRWCHDYFLFFFDTAAHSIADGV